MRIVLAPDSFKGSLSSLEVCNALSEGILQELPESEITKIPMADGGEGTVEALIQATGGRIIECVVTGPTGRPVKSYFGVLGDGKTAVIEMAAASGLPLISESERNPMITTTYGTGELIKAALDNGCRSLIVGIGGSATNDGGAGMAQALGFRLVNDSGEDIPWGGGGLLELDRIIRGNEDARLQELQVTIACDVTNVLCGPNGASRVYGPQKGATSEMVEKLDAALCRYAEIVKRDLGVEIADMPGSGAAGGLGGGLVAFLSAVLMPGVEIVIEASKLREHVACADLVITGEGKMDFQTLSGKTPLGVAKVALEYEVPVIGIAGWQDADMDDFREYGFRAMLGICPRPMSTKEAMDNAYVLVRDTGRSIASLLKLGSILCS